MWPPGYMKAQQSTHPRLGYLETKSPTWPPLGNNLDGFFAPRHWSGVRPRMGSPDLPRPQTVSSSLSVRATGHLSLSLHKAANKDKYFNILDTWSLVGSIVCMEKVVGGRQSGPSPDLPPPLWSLTAWLYSPQWLDVKKEGEEENKHRSLGEL